MRPITADDFRLSGLRGAASSARKYGSSKIPEAYKDDLRFLHSAGQSGIPGYASGTARLAGMSSGAKWGMGGTVALGTAAAMVHHHNNNRSSGRRGVTGRMMMGKMPMMPSFMPFGSL